MKVLLVTGSYPPTPCGVGDYTFRLAEALAAEDGVEVGVLTGVSAAVRAVREPGVQLFPFMKNWRLREAATIRKVLRQWRPDIVHVQYPTQAYGRALLPSLVPALALQSGAKAVRTWHEGSGLRNGPKFFLQSIVPGPFAVVRPQFRRLLPPLLRPLLRWKKGGLIPGASSIPRSRLTEDQRQLLRTSHLQGESRLIVFFGFLYRFKGVELIFEVANPTTDRIVIAGESGMDAEYVEELRRHADEEPWRGRVSLTGFLSNEDTANLLAAADAVVLPFRRGGGSWNSSIHAAVLQGTPVVTTSDDGGGLDEERCIYFARTDDVDEMRQALGRLAGKRRPLSATIDQDEWPRIAAEHIALYEGRFAANEIRLA